MTDTQKQTPAEFFYEHAGYSFDPLTQTAELGRQQCAKELAEAERLGNDAGLSFEWDRDGNDSCDWTDERHPATPTWQCFCRSETGKHLASLSGIDFADHEPWGDPYRRVIEAELAQEALTRI